MRAWMWVLGLAMVCFSGVLLAIVPPRLHLVEGAVDNAKVCVNSNGDSVAVWSRSVNLQRVIQAASLPHGSTVWTSPACLSDSRSRGFDPQLVISPLGDAVVIWTESLAGGKQVIQASTMRYGSVAWSPAVAISDELSNASNPSVVADSQGDVYAIWLGSLGTGPRVPHAAIWSCGTAAWSKPARLSDCDDPCDSCQIAVDSLGNALALWTACTSEARCVMSATLEHATMTWADPVNVTRTGSGRILAFLQMAFDASGNAIAVWEDYCGGEYRTTGLLQSATLPRGGSTWTMATLDRTYFDPPCPRVAFDLNGRAVAVWIGVPWQRGDMCTCEVHAAMLSPGAPSWTSSVVISSSCLKPSKPYLAFDLKGDAISVFSEAAGNTRFLDTTTLPLACDTWTKPKCVVSSEAWSDCPLLATDRLGNVFAVWEARSASGVWGIQAATLKNGEMTWAPADLTDYSRNSRSPQIVVDSCGNVVALWIQQPGTIQAAVLPFDGKEWQRTSDMSGVSDPRRY